MRIKKNVLFLLLILIFLDLIIISVFEFNRCILIPHKALFYNISISIFSGILLLGACTTLEYLDYKKRTLENFIEYSYMITRNYLDIKPVSEKISRTDLIDNLKLYRELSKMDMVEYGKLYSEIDFVFASKMKKFIYNDIYNTIMDIQYNVRDIVIHTDGFLENIEKEDWTNYPVLKYYITRFQKLFFISEVELFENSYTSLIRNITSEKLYNNIEKLRSWMYKEHYEKYPSEMFYTITYTNTIKNL